MKKETEKLRRLLTIAINRNDTKAMIKLRKLLLEMSQGDDDLEEMNGGLFDD